MDYEFLQASDATGNAVLASVQTNRLVASNVLDVDTIENWPQKFIATVGTVLTSGYFDPATVTEFRGHLQGQDIIIDTYEAGFTNIGNTTGQKVVIKQTTGWADLVFKTVEKMEKFGGLSGGWNPLTGASVLSVTNLGQHSYDVIVAGDKRNLITPKMRLRATRTVAASTQSMAFVFASSQIARKTTPVGINFTTAFTLEANVFLNSVRQHGLIARDSGGAGGGFGMFIDSSGRANIFFRSALGTTVAQTWASVPTKKKTHIAMRVDSLASGFFTCFFDGIQIPMTVTASGATTLLQGGNLEVGGFAAGNFADAFISDARIWSTIRTDAQIRENMSQPLVGNEAGLVAYFKGDGNFNDSTANANHLTAINGAIATQASSPFGTQGDNTQNGLLDYAIVQRTALSGSDTRFTVQTPEGCTLPTSGGISAISYSSETAPYNFPSQAKRWNIECLQYADRTMSIGALNTIYEAEHLRLTVPIGEWKFGKQVMSAIQGTVSANMYYKSYVGTAAGAVGELRELMDRNNVATGQELHISGQRETNISLDAATTYRHLHNAEAAGGTVTIRYFANAVGSDNRLYAENAYL